MNEFIIVLSAELQRRLRSRIFFVGLLIGMLAVALLVRLPNFLDSAITKASGSIVVLGEPRLVAVASPLLAKDFKIVATERYVGDLPTSGYLDRHKKAFGALILQRKDQQLHVTAYARDLTLLSNRTIQQDLGPLNVALATSLSQARIASLLRVAVESHSVGSKYSSEESANNAQAIAYMLLIFLYISILLNSQLVTSSVAEEKTSRIAELLVASVNPTALLLGKIIAAGVLAVIQMVSWIAVAILLTPHGPQPPGGMALVTGGIAPIVAFAFIAFFLLGYLQFSTIYAAAASLISRTEDLGSITGPLVMPVVGAFFLAMYALRFPNAPLSVTTSFIPIVAPFVMFARIAVAEIPGWQIALSLLINIGAVGTILWGAGKIYRVGMLLYGRPPKLKQIFATLRS